MAYVGRVSVSYGDRVTRLERLRAADTAFEAVRTTLEQCERLWVASQKSRDERLLACVAVAAALSDFALKAGISLYAKERLNDLLVALDEPVCGRRSVLLSPTPVHAGKFSTTDLHQQALAQVCVDVLRKAGASATAARKQVSGLFEKNRLPKFSEAKLRTLNSRLKGPGCTQDEAYEIYLWTQRQMVQTATNLGIWPIESHRPATKLVDRLASLAKRRDHRRDFFFAPSEDRSELP